MKEQQAGVPAEPDRKKEALHAVCSVYDQWIRRFPLACRKGCAACCTMSVTMTSLEGQVILDFVQKRGREKWLLAKLAQAGPGERTPGMTTNQFAGACLNRQEVDEASSGCWDFAPCLFLEEKTCAIYEVRPFGCRSFGSLVRCAAGGTAEMAPIHLTVNTVLAQVIEHICSDGGYWSAMADILLLLTGRGVAAPGPHLLPARPIPGFLLAPREAEVIRALLHKLCPQCTQMGIFGDLIDNFLPIE